jgi:hypothetical protein
MKVSTHLIKVSNYNVSLAQTEAKSVTYILSHNFVIVANAI